MKHIVYTCLKCGKQATVDAGQDVVPPEWATIHYGRFHMTTLPEGSAGMVQTTAETHACGDCAKGILDYLQPPPKTAAPLKSA
jgi:hypothetical protein